jgi:hypothetical protein
VWGEGARDEKGGEQSRRTGRAAGMERGGAPGAVCVRV